VHKASSFFLPTRQLVAVPVERTGGRAQLVVDGALTRFEPPFVALRETSATPKKTNLLASPVNAWQISPVHAAGRP